jgi:hypothetical protein
MPQFREVKRTSPAATRAATDHLRHNYPSIGDKIEKVFVVSVLRTTETTNGEEQDLDLLLRDLDRGS